MDHAELQRLLTDLESDRVERKESLSEPDRIREAICAFANDLPDHRAPGYIFVGVRDDGSGVGRPVTDDLLLKLANMRDDGSIQPLPAMEVQKQVFGGCEVAVVAAHPHSAPPVRFRGRTWIRVGPRRAQATREEEHRLTERRRSRDLPFDVRPLPSATLDALDLDLFQRTYLPAAIAPDVLEQNERTMLERLQGLRFADGEGRPTVLGMLVLGIDPHDHVGGAYVQFLRVDGGELTDPIRHQKSIHGPLPDLLRRLDEVIEAQISVATEITSGPVEVRHPDYPLAALQQLARNAVMHRDYELSNAPIRITWFNDRIEIQSPGGPFGQVSIESFGNPGVTDYRNPHIAEAMRVLGYVQRFGVGIPIARKELAKNGNPPPVFEPKPSHVLVCVRKRP